MAVCSNSAWLQCYSATIAAIKQYFLLNYGLQNNVNLFKFRYAIAPQFDDTKVNTEYFISRLLLSRL